MWVRAPPARTARSPAAQVSHVKAERDALAASENPWVVNLHYSFQDDEYLYLVMDFCAGGDLMTLLIKEDVLPETWLRFYAAEAVLAIASVHAMGYIHRDLKVRRARARSGAERMTPVVVSSRFARSRTTSCSITADT